MSQSPLPDDTGLFSLAQRIRHAFPVAPIPPYPPLMGLSPGGVDEYAPFANQPWTAVAPIHFNWTAYDISPGIGFQSHEPPHLWNYFFPGFISAALLHESAELNIIDGILWNLREVRTLPVWSDSPRDPWWGGATPFAHYTGDQARLVIAFLRFVRDHGRSSRLDYEWEAADGAVLARWETSLDAE